MMNILLQHLDLYAHLGHQRDLTTFALQGTLVMGAVGGIVAAGLLFYWKRGESLSWVLGKAPQLLAKWHGYAIAERWTELGCGTDEIRLNFLSQSEQVAT